jgi:hypothetical protein
MENTIDYLREYKDRNINKKEKKKIINYCRQIESYWGKYINKEKYNNKRKGTKLEEKIEKERMALEDKQPRKDEFLEKLHRFEYFIENYNEKTEEEKGKSRQEKEIVEDIKEEEDEEVKEEVNKGKLMDTNIISTDSKHVNNKNKEEKISTNINTNTNFDISTNINTNTNFDINTNSDQLIKNSAEGRTNIDINQQIITNSNNIINDKESENKNIEEKENINEKKRTAIEIISEGKLFDEEEKNILKSKKGFHFENGKIVKGDDMTINKKQKDDDKSLKGLIHNTEYNEIKKRALKKKINLKLLNTNKENLEKLEDDLNDKNNIENVHNENIIVQDEVIKEQQNNAEDVIKKVWKLKDRTNMKEEFDQSKYLYSCKKFFLKEGYHGLLKKYPDLFKKKDDYSKADKNNVVEDEKEKYEKIINIYNEETSKISHLILLRGFGRLAISFLFSTINSIMQFERKDVIGPYFSIYTLSFGKIVQPSLLGKNIYIDISLSILSLLIFSAIDYNIDRDYLLGHKILGYKIKSPLCKFLSLIKYSTNAFNININFFVNKDFYMSFNIMSIFDSILSWYWFNKFEEKINEDIIKNCKETIKSIEKRRETTEKFLETVLDKQKIKLRMRWAKIFLRHMLINDIPNDKENVILLNDEKNIEKENNINNAPFNSGKDFDEDNINNDINTNKNEEEEEINNNL